MKGRFHFVFLFVLLALASQINCKKETALPTVITASVESIESNTAICGGTIKDNGGETISAKGVCWGTQDKPTTANNKTNDGNGDASFTSQITGLSPGVTYYVRAYATSSAGTGYGESRSFTTTTAFASVSTLPVTDITSSTATCGGNITSDGGVAVTARGVCWSNEPNPTTADGYTTDGNGTGEYTSQLTGLAPNTSYYVRAYAISSKGTSYGESKSFTTYQTFVEVSTKPVSNITSSGATSGGIASSNGGPAIIARGVCWSKNTNPTISDSKTNDGNGDGEYTSIITGLSSNTTYHIRAYATTANGTAYGTNQTFTTNYGLASISSLAANSVASTTAICGGIVNSDGGTPVVAVGICWSTTPNPTIENNKTLNDAGVVSFVSSLSNLNPNTTYYARAYATNSMGVAYGNEVIFTTQSNASNLDQMLLGNPSEAVNNIQNPNNYLMIKPQYALSYNNSKRTMNWTSWHLYSGDIGSAQRQDDFRADYTLPSSWYKVTETDYMYTTYGFDRGHMCPSADRTSSTSNNSATFLMTNMIPQAPNNNQKSWAYLEDYERALVDASNELYILSGPYGSGGTSAKGTFTVLSSGVTVPSHTWKIIVVLSNGDNDLNRINTSTRVIAVLMPNTQECTLPWRNYRVSVDAIESLTGYNFLSNVPTEIQDVIEARVDNL